MEFILFILLAGAIFGICYMVDKSFTKAFRSKAQHRSGLAVRVSKMYGIMGIVLCIIGVMAIMVGFRNYLLLIGGVIVLAMGAAMVVYYLTKGIFYDGESFLVSGFGKKETLHYYKDILQQRLYLVQGGNIIIELHMADGSAVSLQSNMDGIYPFLDTAFAGWCLATGQDPQSCSFHDPSNHWWFPHEEES